MGTVVNNGMGDIIIHDDVHTGIGCILIGPMEIHRYAGLAQYVRIIGMHHGMGVERPHHQQPSIAAPIVIGEDAFIGTGTVVLGKKDGGVLTIGQRARIGANAVVLDDIPPFSVVVGNPARVIRIWDFEQKKWIKTRDDDHPAAKKGR